MGGVGHEDEVIQETRKLEAYASRKLEAYATGWGSSANVLKEWPFGWSVILFSEHIDAAT